MIWIPLPYLKKQSLHAWCARDDFRRSDKVLNPNVNDMEVGVENKRIVLIDDVLYVFVLLKNGVEIESYTHNLQTLPQETAYIPMTFKSP